MRRSAQFSVLLAVLLAACAGSLFLAFFVGSSGISWPEFTKLVSGQASDTVRNVFLELRLPRAVGALLVGCALAVSGAGLQSVFQNPMADPYILGISAGAGFGAAVALSFLPAQSTGLIALISFIAALSTILVVYNIARSSGRVTTFSLLLSGFVMSSLMSALLSLVMILHRDKMEQVVMWNMGSLTALSWEKVWVLLPVCAAGVIALAVLSRPLNALLLGEESAQGLGVDTRATRRAVLIVTSLLAAAAVAVAGVIGFVGLMVPHLLRLVQGPDNRTLIPLCAAGGGAYLLLCDITARTIVPSRELPVGVITAIFGVPFFVYLLRNGRKDPR